MFFSAPQKFVLDFVARKMPLFRLGTSSPKVRPVLLRESVMEDGFQMLLYTLISACQVKGSVSVSAVGSMDSKSRTLRTGAQT